MGGPRAYTGQSIREAWRTRVQQARSRMLSRQTSNGPFLCVSMEVFSRSTASTFSRNFALHCTRNVAQDLAQPIRSPNKSSSIARFISVPAYPIDLGTLKYKTLGVVAVEVQLVLQSSGVFSAHQFRAFRGETLNSSSLQSWILSLATH